MNPLRWHLIRWRYRRHGQALDGAPDDEIWYFAFGSNMNPAVLAERRGIRPSEWRAGRLEGYRLRFNLDGRPPGRSAPANIEPDPGAELWGVLYRMTLADLVRIDASEGVPRRGRYHHLHVEIEDAAGGRLPAVTYMAPGNAEDGRPSLRYLTLLRDGARAHGLPTHYIRFLDAVRHAE